MKKHLLIISMMLGIFFSIPNVYALKEASVEKIFIKTDDLYVNMGTSLYMDAIVFPSSADNKKVKWSSSDATIASIDSDTGELTTNYKTGIVTIKATATDGSGIFGSIDLYVGYTAIRIGEIASLKTPLIPYSDAEWDITDKTIVESTRKEGACLNNNCEYNMNVRGIENGSTTIQLKTISGVIIRNSIVYVYTPISELSTDLSKLELAKGDIKKLNITLTPNNISSGLNKLIYISNDESIVTVDQNGNVKALKNGSTNIVVYSQYNNVSVTIPVTVNTYSESLELDTYTLNLNDENRTHQIIYEVLPEEAINKDVTFESDNTSVATVSSSGVITAKSNGTATITVTTSNGLTKKCKVTVGEYQRGDFSKNGEVKLDDAIIGLRKVFGYISSDSSDLSIGDLNNNGKLDLADIIILLRYIFGYINNI